MKAVEVSSPAPHPSPLPAWRGEGILSLPSARVSETGPLAPFMGRGQGEGQAVNS